ncbi:MAG: ThiF family adenylyltransferase [bacterium]|nr:ThiF family adenylyltransferase [bacterium]
MSKFDKFINLVSSTNYELLKTKKIMVIGLGGVGGYVVEALVRCGIENIVLVDCDVIEATNINRQIIALSSTIGMRKTTAFYQRIKDINDECNVLLINDFIDKDNINIIDKSVDYVVDAIDSIDSKKAIIRHCLKEKIKFISCMGMGNKLDPSMIEITDIRKTSYDKIAKIIRKMVKEENIKQKIMVVSSKEQPISSNNQLNSCSFVPSVAGLMCASYIINDIIKNT